MVEMRRIFVAKVDRTEESSDGVLLRWKWVKYFTSELTCILSKCTGFAIGGTNNSFYNGQYLADSEDVVVVTVK